MKADEFLRAHAPERHLPTLHDDLNNDELAKLDSKFGLSTSDLRELTPRAPDPAQRCDLAGGPIPTL
jgi:hypothetical protein